VEKTAEAVNRQYMHSVNGADPRRGSLSNEKEHEMSKLIAGLIASLFAVSVYAAPQATAPAAAPAATASTEPAATAPKKAKKAKKTKKAAAESHAAEPTTK
jgi:hypothetical protein